MKARPKDRAFKEDVGWKNLSRSDQVDVEVIVSSKIGVGIVGDKAIVIAFRIDSLKKLLCGGPLPH